VNAESPARAREFDRMIRGAPTATPVASLGHMRLYDYPASQNCYKVRQLLAHLGTPHQTTEVDIFAGEARTAEFLRMSPTGCVPVLEPEPGVFIPESNAILFYLAQGTPYWPADRAEQAWALQWMFFEQESHQPSIATLRHWTLTGKLSRYPALVEPKRRQGIAVLTTMDRHLAGRPFFAGTAYSVADISLYAYTHLAHQGGFVLEDFPAVVDWLARVRDQPGHLAEVFPYPPSASGYLPSEREAA
jgi:glutathione S-transferase